jgi:hypothetical protein
MSGRAQFVVALITALILGVLALWLAWVKDTGQWGYQILFYCCVAFVGGLLVGRDSRVP